MKFKFLNSPNSNVETTLFVRYFELNYDSRGERRYDQEEWAEVFSISSSLIDDLLNYKHINIIKELFDFVVGELQLQDITSSTFIECDYKQFNKHKFVPKNFDGTVKEAFRG